MGASCPETEQHKYLLKGDRPLLLHGHANGKSLKCAFRLHEDPLNLGGSMMDCALVACAQVPHKLLPPWCMRIAY